MIATIVKDVKHLEFSPITDSNAKCYNDFRK